MKPYHLLLLTSATAALGEKTVTPVIDSVGTFKNGLTVVRASFPIDGPGGYRWEKVPNVVHGSLWVESDGKVVIQSTTRMVAETDKVEKPVGQLQRDLAGKNITVTLRGIPTMLTSAASMEQYVVSGTVWDLPSHSVTKTWDTDYSSLNASSGSYYWQRNRIFGNNDGIPAQPTTGNFLVLDDSGGTRRYISQSDISSISVNGPFKPVTRMVEKPVLVFDVTEVPETGGRVSITYLSKGLAWMPSYRIDLTDPEKLRIRHSAVVRNEMDEIADTELQLISGFPNIRFGSVDSPLWPGTSLAAFFQQVNGSSSGGNGFDITSNIMTQQAVYMNNPGRGANSPLPNFAEAGNISDDIHYESIGKRSMKAGDSLSLDVMEDSARYQRVVEWTVPDPRNERGRYDSRDRPAESEAWDAVRFLNPFKAPMTTAATSITEQGKFRGQSQSDWVNPGQQTCIKITRALSIHTRSSETEEEGEREIVYIAGDDYQRTKVKGRLTVRNFRSVDTVMAIRCEFSGELLEADGDPEKSLRVEGATSINPRRQLDWTITVPAGEEMELSYRYELLVDH